MSTEIPPHGEIPAAPSKDKSDIRLVSRISAVLRVLSDHPGGLSLGAIAKASAIPRGTVQRVIDALETEGMVARGAEDASIRLGQEIARLGMTMNQDVQQFFRPILIDLRDASGETVDLTILHPQGATVIDQIASPQALRVVSRPGQLLPLHATSSGKAHLTQLPADQQRTRLSGPLAAFTARTVTDPAALLAEIRAVSPGQPFFDRGEFADGVCAISIDLGGAGLGNIAVAISMPAARFNERGDNCTRLLVDLRARMVR